MASSESLKEAGLFYLDGIISTENVKPAIEWIFERNMKQKSDGLTHLTLIINSPGGYLTQAFALIDAMEGSKIPIHTVGLGEISSCGFLIFISGQKGERTLTPNTSILSHQYSGGTWGKEHDLIASQKDFKLTSKRMVEHYIKHTGLTKKQIEKVLLPPHDVYLTAKQAKEYGICDKVAKL